MGQLHDYLAMSIVDALCFQGFGNSPERLPSDNKVFAGYGSEFYTKGHHGVPHAAHPLGFNRSDKIGAQYRVLQHFLSDFLDGFAYFFNIGIVGQLDVEFDHHPPPHEIGYRTQIAKRNDLQHSPVVPQHHIAQGNGLHRPRHTARLYVFAHSKGIVHEEEEP